MLYKFQKHIIERLYHHRRQVPAVGLEERARRSKVFREGGGR